MHTYNDTRTVTNTLALYGVTHHAPTYYRVRAVVRFLAYLAIVATVFLGPHALVAAVSPYTTPCATEDSTNCTWHAPTQGNGQGASFTDINGTAYAW